MRRTAKPIHYYVEGECEEKLINALKVGRDNKIAAGNLSPLLLHIKTLLPNCRKWILMIKKSGLALMKKSRLANILAKSLSILFTKSKDKFLVKSFSWPPVFSFRIRCNRGVFLPLRTRCRNVFRSLPFRVFYLKKERRNGGWLRLMLWGSPQER